MRPVASNFLQTLLLSMSFISAVLIAGLRPRSYDKTRAKRESITVNEAAYGPFEIEHRIV